MEKGDTKTSKVSSAQADNCLKKMFNQKKYGKLKNDVVVEYSGISKMKTKIAKLDAHIKNTNKNYKSTIESLPPDTTEMIWAKKKISKEAILNGRLTHTNFAWI